MRRADRLFQIVQYLRGGRLVTSTWLADQLEVSQRTIYRDIVDLQASGVPIDGEAGVGYVMEEGYDLPPLMFTNDEIVALVAGARFMRAFGGASLARGAEEALVKINAVLPDEARARAENVPIEAHGVRMDNVLRLALDQFQSAADRHVRLEFEYEDRQGAKTRRQIRPLGLWFWGSVWTPIGWCELRQDFRMFRLDRMGGFTESGPFKVEHGKRLTDFYRKMEREEGRKIPR